VSDAIHWVGAVSNPYPYYLWADLVVVPSRFEGFPNVLLEAMACGRATIAADCKTGPRELTENGRYGVLVPVNDIAALAQGIVELANDVGKQRLLGNAAREHVQKLYDIDVVAQMYLDLVERKL
jgi:glycosyltransferase involved in cell wall biosynthesis